VVSTRPTCGCSGLPALASGMAQPLPETVAYG
jgi:hypothetical protein